MDLKTPLTQITGIGQTYAKRLAYLNLLTVEDLIHHYPFRYDDFSKSSQIAQAKIGDIVTIQGEVWAIKNIYSRSGKILTKATVNDGTGSIEVIWFNQSWLTKQIKEGTRIQLSGKIARYGSKTTLVAPSWEKVTNAITDQDLQKLSLHTGRLVPIYPETYGVTSKWLRAKISSLLKTFKDKIPDPLPESIRNGMISLSEALTQIHMPKDYKEAQEARKRLAFDELFYIQLATQQKRIQWQKKKLINPLSIDGKKLNSFVKNLPFELTTAQKRVISEIVEDLQKNKPMNRLVQGDVGSGKTVVAAAIIYLVYLNQLKSVLMAPTEILAFQHYDTLSKLLSPYGINVGIYTGSKKFTKNDDKRLMTKANEKNHSSSIIHHQSIPNVIVGTHALLSDKLQLDQVGLIVIDEQQRFGVEQRSILRNKANSPHFLTMTATPIPRTVALTLYGDLDLSVIDELPKGRKIVRTYFVPKNKRYDAYNFIAQQIDKGFQVYIITPLIEESETIQSAKAATVEYERLQTTVFKKYRVGLLHGKMKAKEKDQVLMDFKNHKIDILVSTSVVEVGVDVPNATVMVIEGAERFGLAQLHQLRGRVGRGSEQSYAFLFTEEESYPVISRLKNLEKIYDGLVLAELDFKIRGSGEIFGTKQSGTWDLKVASLSDVKLIERTRQAALDILSKSPDLDKYPEIKRKLSSLASKEVMPD